MFLRLRVVLLTRMKVAIVYDRLNKWGGAERVLLCLQSIFTNAQLFTSLHTVEGSRWVNKFVKVNVSPINKIPYLRDKHEYLGTLMPIIFENFDFSSFDLVISVTSEAAKGIITGTDTKHVCYCLTPTRYLWSHYGLYFDKPLLRYLSYPAVSYLRRWDKVAAQRPDKMIAVSSAVRDRIRTYYGRDSIVVHPPMTLKLKAQSSKHKTAPRKADYFLVVSRLVPYKRVDLAVNVFNEPGFAISYCGNRK